MKQQQHSVRGFRFSVGVGAFLGAAVMSVALMVAMPAQAATVYVNGAAGGNNDGTSWTDAYTTLADALANVSDSGDQIWVAQGTYTESSQLAINNSNLTIYGGFTSGMTDLSQRDITNFVVKVDGNLAYRCFNITGANVTLDGLTIQRGNFGGYGGGIYNTGSGLVVQSCVISNCTTTGEGAGGDYHAGGGIYSTQPMQVLNSTVVNNKASTSGNGYGGGGIYFNSTGTLLVSNTVFQSNMAQDQSAGDKSYGTGGAIHMYAAGQLKAFNCVFDSNGVLHYEPGYPDKTHRGGAIYFENNSAVGQIVNCTFYGNYVVYGYGGGIYSAGAPLYITNCIFWANTDNFTGKQIYSESGTVSINYGCFSGTTADDIYAGGMLTTNNIITSDPLFANAAGHDLHLQSRGGRWTSSGWVKDSVISPCIDAGNPASACDNELPFNGGRINLGAYGNTAQASKTAADTAVNNELVTYVPGQTVATLNGMLTYTGAAPAEVWVYWGTVDGTDNATGLWANTNYFGTSTAALPAPYATNVTVELNTTYYYTYKSANAYGTNWATPSATFFTIGVPPKMTVQATDANAAELGADPGVFTVYGDNNMVTNQPLTVYYTIGGTASNGSDYATILSSVTIPTDSTSATITITPSYDTLVEDDETVTLTLVPGPLQLYTVDSPGSATVTIADNTAAGAVVYLDPNVTGGRNDGTSWANACTNFASALARVGAGGAIWVVQGNYLNGTEIAVSSPNITILGGFTNGMTQLAQRNPSANPVVVDGNNAYRCFGITATNVTLDGLTLQRGAVTSDKNGAGINSSGAGLVIRNCVIQNCTTLNNGFGAGIASSASMSIVDSLLATNVAALGMNGGAGGIYFTSSGALLVSNTVFRGNVGYEFQAGSEEYGCGGAIYMYADGQLNALNCLFDGNQAIRRFDSAIYRRTGGGASRIVNCTFYGNVTSTNVVNPGGTAFYGGGAIYTKGSPLYMTNCIFWANSSSVSTGVQVYATAGTVTVGYCSLPGTGADEIYAGGTLTLSHVITEDPLFADAAGHDFHLKSSGGRWTPGSWVKDAVTSPCIDAGDPASSYALESEPNGKRINLGADGNTAQASRSKPPAGTVLILR
ncbi:MAG: hypothetical protein WCK89_16265 [bacterium]